MDVSSSFDLPIGLVLGSVIGGVVGSVSWRMWRSGVSLLLLPAQAVYAMMQANYEKNRTEFLQRHGHMARRIEIPAMDGVSQIDAVFLNGTGRPDLGPEDRLYMHFNPNGVVYEDKLEHVVRMQQKMLRVKGWACNVLIFNYRGVGGSTGTIRSGADLENDAVAVIKYAISGLKVRPQNLILHGHSIGGAAAIMAYKSLFNSSVVTDEIAKNSPVNWEEDKVGPFVLADRTFFDLLDVVEEKLGQGGVEMKVIGGLLGLNVAVFLILVICYGFGVTLVPFMGLASFSAFVMAKVFFGVLNDTVEPDWPLKPMITKAQQSGKQYVRFLKFSTFVIKFTLLAAPLLLGSYLFGPAWAYILLFMRAGLFLGEGGYLDKFALHILRFMEWEMNVRDGWEAIPSHRKAIVFHSQDELITPNVSILKIANGDVAIPLTSTTNNPHMYDVFSEEDECRMVLEALQPVFS